MLNYNNDNNFNNNKTNIYENKSRCSFCGGTIQTYIKTGKLGCSQCYTSLREDILPIIKRLHYSHINLGSIPMQYAAGMPLSLKIYRLEKEAEKAKKSKDSARLDKINAQIKRLGGNGAI